MSTYISILRGINVSGKHLIKMEALRTTYENAGFSSVQSYVQSGNIVFQSDSVHTGELEQEITRLIKTDFGFEVPVIVLSTSTLKRIIENNPFLKQEKDPGFFHVTFLSEKPEQDAVSVIEAKKSEGEAIAFSDEAVYLYCPNGYGKTRLTNTFIESKLSVTATTRNWRTVNELLRIAEKTADHSEK